MYNLKMYAHRKLSQNSILYVYTYCTLVISVKMCLLVIVRNLITYTRLLILSRGLTLALRLLEILIHNYHPLPPFCHA